VKPLLALLLLAGCYGPGVHFISGAWWEFDPTMPVCTRVDWLVESRARLDLVCGRGYDACALLEVCAVVSVYSEGEAMGVWTGGMLGESLYDHERRHVLERMRHPK
jgi:hypothetical protein